MRTGLIVAIVAITAYVLYELFSASKTYGMTSPQVNSYTGLAPKAVISGPAQAPSTVPTAGYIAAGTSSIAALLKSLLGGGTNLQAPSAVPTAGVTTGPSQIGFATMNPGEVTIEGKYVSSFASPVTPVSTIPYGPVDLQPPDIGANQIPDSVPTIGGIDNSGNLYYD